MYNPWLLLSIIANVKENAELDLDTGPSSDFSQSVSATNFKDTPKEK